MQDILWVEKYRPQKFDDIIGQDMDRIKALIKDPMSMPHFLFVSKSAGTGKTTTAKVIQKEIGLSNRDFLTCNSSDERKVDFIRGTIKNFAITMRSDKTKPKIILMDEFDGMLVPSQDMLRGIIEKYVSNTRFILTANNEEAIIEPIRSRCTTIRFREPPKDAICDRLVYICDKEGVKHTAEGIQKVVNMYYPDIRSMINKIQELASVGIDESFIKGQSDIEEQFFLLLRERNPIKVRQYVIDNNLANEEMLRSCLNKVMEIAQTQEQAREMVYFIALTTDRMAKGSDKEIVFFALVIKWLEIF